MRPACIKRYRLKDIKAADGTLIHRARDIGREAGLEYVYTGNLPGDTGGRTVCCACGKLPVDRCGFSVGGNHIQDGLCRFCRVRVPGVWS